MGVETRINAFEKLKRYFDSLPVVRTAIWLSPTCTSCTSHPSSTKLSTSFGLR